MLTDKRRGCFRCFKSTKKYFNSKLKLANHTNSHFVWSFIVVWENKTNKGGKEGSDVGTAEQTYGSRPWRHLCFISNCTLDSICWHIFLLDSLTTTTHFFLQIISPLFIKNLKLFMWYVTEHKRTQEFSENPLNCLSTLCPKRQTYLLPSLECDSPMRTFITRIPDIQTCL